ncbi:hypothetical protein IEO21_03362 [Rhodonia placenta]|uniref:Aprataxin and PNK-like factor PBZ domain-containing protein n=1 Tax=Rhodonia placenta TaxID=104341 RepID=A0A8H7P5T4_9APHY|nr:hypothetical protein IEO21_03362 [Postia placenta]
MTAFSDLSHDLVDRIFTYVRDFGTLAALIRTSKTIYVVFEARPKSIVRAVAQNVIGDCDALPAATRLVRFQLTLNKYTLDYEGDDDDDTDNQRPKDPGPTEEDVLLAPLTRAEANLLEWHGPVVQELEDIFSWRNKDRASPKSTLTLAESSRFCSAMYRFWLYCEVHGPPEYWEDDEPQDFSQECANFFKAYVLDDIFDIARAADFIADLVAWCDGALGDPALATPPKDWFRCKSSMGPSAVLNDFKTISSSQPENAEAGFFWRAYESHIRTLKLDPKVCKERLTKAILTEVVGQHDTCFRCHAVQGINLYGATTWPLLRGQLCQTKLFARMPGNLGRNGGEKQQFLLSTNWGVFIGSQFDYTKMMDEIMDIHDDQEHIWQKDKWYCFQCVEQLMKERLWRWWRERKEQEGKPVLPNCWYGWNCRTMTHRPQHASKLNHLCKPTRGDDLTQPQPASGPTAHTLILLPAPTTDNAGA